MSWARLDDGIYDHPKVTALLEHEDGWAAVGFYCMTLAWAHKHTRKPGKIPGYLPRAAVIRMDRSVGAAYAALLVACGLWETSDGGWHIHDFADYLPSLETSMSRAESGRRGGIASGQARKRSKELHEASIELQNRSVSFEANEANGEANTGSGIGSSKEVKVVDGSVKSARQRAAKRGTRLPDDFSVTKDMVAWCHRRCPGIDGKSQTEQFMNYWSAKTGSGATKLDWVKTWQNWMITAYERTGNTNGHKPSTSVITPETEYMARR